ncbi:type IX secretion system membrane protein PorP/SprF [Mucilaginibacter terrigena]|uniref:Type IX secretion system membrane protein PorP/SprF n=1 Tax=Mucilaginibacter terrigena TaxID=2492395 RepID=A0A4Q5LQG8_9SPHI|nr:PorP/SprF family type IX secretion system membrane protein [Mucilaginibacter terrigena]RYU91692.1 type IX secretion system membrane protein PorP/SprF [Mucilaginibacter terrigena]
MRLNLTKKQFVLILSVLLMISSSTLMAQQQIYSYSQYADNLIPINPAYSMLDKAGSLNLMGRKQFIGIEGAPSSLLFSGSLPIESIGGAAGVYVLNDQVAVERQLEVNAFFAKSIQLTSTGFLAVSLNAGVRNYVANYSSVDPTGGDGQFRDDVRETRPNIGFGVMFYSSKYYLGFSLPELTIRSLGTASVQDANYLKNHYYFSGAYLADLTDDIKFKPSTLVSYVNGSPLLADITGTIYLKEQLGLGASYRTNKKASGIISVNTETFKVGYSYQFGIASNNLGGFNAAIHEVSLSYRFGKTGERKLL